MKCDPSMHRYANFFQSVCNCGSEIKSGDPVWLGASRTMWAHSSITVQLPTTTVASTEESKYNISTSANTTLTSQSVQWGADASLECELLPNPPPVSMRLIWVTPFIQSPAQVRSVWLWVHAPVSRNNRGVKEGEAVPDLMVPRQRKD